MRIPTFIRKALVDEKRLTPLHRRITTGVGLIGVFIGIIAFCLYAKASRAALGLPMESVPLEGIWLQFVLWVMGLLLAIPLLFYAGCVLVAGMTGCVLLAFGKMTRVEVIRYMLLSEYPARWLELMPNKSLERRRGR